MSTQRLIPQRRESSGSVGCAAVAVAIWRRMCDAAPTSPVAGCSNETLGGFGLAIRSRITVDRAFPPFNQSDSREEAIGNTSSLFRSPPPPARRLCDRSARVWRPPRRLLPRSRLPPRCGHYQQRVNKKIMMIVAGRSKRAAPCARDHAFAQSTASFRRSHLAAESRLPSPVRTGVGN